MKKKRSRVVRRRIHIVLIGIVAAAAAFFGLFYTTDMEITGNSRYTDAQIRSMVQTDPLCRNTVLMSLLHRTVRVDAPLISSVRVSFVTRNRLRITVSEKYPVGYISLFHWTEIIIISIRMALCWRGRTVTVRPPIRQHPMEHHPAEAWLPRHRHLHRPRRQPGSQL